MDDYRHRTDGPERLYVAVVGGSTAGAVARRASEEVGRELARAQAVLVCGGLGGVMEAACRGAKAEGGVTVGILPGDDRRAANPWVDVAVPTGMGEGRNILVVRAADAVIAVGGEYGTLSEIALALRLGKPVVGLATWEFRRAGTDGDRAGTDGDPDGDQDGDPRADPIVRVDDPVVAARTALRLASVT